MLLNVITYICKNTCLMDWQVEGQAQTWVHLHSFDGGQLNIVKSFQLMSLIQLTVISVW